MAKRHPDVHVYEGVSYRRYVIRYRNLRGQRVQLVLWSQGPPWVREEVSRILYDRGDLTSETPVDIRQEDPSARRTRKRPLPSTDTLRALLGTAVHEVNRATVAADRASIGSVDRAFDHLLEASRTWEVAADALEELGRTRDAARVRGLARTARRSDRRAFDVAHRLVTIGPNGQLVSL